MDDMRRGQCPLCNHPEIVKTNPASIIGTGVVAPLYAHHVNRDSLWSPGGQPFGETHLYVCRSCGYAQCFITHPDRIPIGPEHHTELITAPAPSGPYR